MVDSTSGAEGAAPQPRPRTGLPLVPLLVTLGLVGLGAVTSFFGGAVLPMASDTCAEGDTHLICTADGQGLVAVGPMFAAGFGVVLAAVGCFRWPRSDWPMWAIAGYTANCIGFVIFYGIATAAS